MTGVLWRKMKESRKRINSLCCYCLDFGGQGTDGELLFEPQLTAEMSEHEEVEYGLTVNSI